MARKRTIEELKQAAQEAEARAKRLREEAAKLTRAEEARQNAELVKAVRRWAESYKGGQYKDKLVELFVQWDEANRRAQN